MNIMAHPADQKLLRIRDGRPRALDLFAGCGGLSMGFTAAGFECILGVEKDPEAVRTYAANFHPGLRSHDMQEDPRHVLEQPLGVEAERAVDVIIGGPPCPAFARVGRGKLSSVSGKPKAFLSDPRSQLWRRYLAYVQIAQPLAIVMENVPDLLHWGELNVGDQICQALQELGYTARYTLLNAANFGVPQYRDRLFLIATHEACKRCQFPAPSRWAEVPKGYANSRAVALKMAKDSPYYEPGPTASTALPKAITVREAIGDLSGDVPSAYAESMRTWLGPDHGPESPAFFRHVSDRDRRIFARMAPGDGYPEAFKHAFEIWKDFPHAAWHQMLPPHNPKTFPNRWRKMVPDEPAKTLCAHLGKEGQSHLHYSEPRPISTREAARLQSFPDRFQWPGSMVSTFRQIGNSVPPLMARALAESVMRCLLESE